MVLQGAYKPCCCDSRVVMRNISKYHTIPNIRPHRHSVIHIVLQENDMTAVPISGLFAALQQAAENKYRSCGLK